MILISKISRKNLKNKKKLYFLKSNILDKESMSLNAYKILLIYEKIKNIHLNMKIIM